MNLNHIDNYKDYLGKFLFILSLVILGLMVFLIIQKPFLHIDEWFTKGLLTISFRDMVHITAADVHPPLYYVTVWVPVRILNFLHIPYDMIFVMKMMSVIPCILLYIIAFTKIRKDYGWLTCGLFTLTLVTMSDLFTVFSIARMYPLGIFLFTCGFICAGEILKHQNIKYWILLTVCAVLGAYTHYFVAVAFAILYALLFLYYFIYNKSELKKWFSSAIYGILCFIPWVFVLYNQMVEIQGGYWISEITFSTLLEFFSSVFSSTSEIIIQVICCVLFVVLFAMTLIEYRKSPKENEIVLLGFLVFIGTILFGVIASILFRPILVVRYLIPIVPAIWLSISILIARLDFKKVIIPLVIVVLLFSTVNIYGQIDEISKNHDNLVSNQEFLDSINNPDSVVVITSKVKLVHFYDELNESIVYEDYTIDHREGARDWARIYDDKDSKFVIPDDVEKYKDKTIYIASREGNDLELPNDYSLEEVGKVENCHFFKLNHT